MRNTKKGFTLMELLVVIAVIGILSAIGLVTLHGSQRKARDAMRKNDLAVYRSAVTLYFDDNNKYPMQGAGNDTANADCINNDGDEFKHNLGGTDFVAAAFNGALSTSGVMITEYLSDQLKPPKGSVAGTSYYCYDTNGDAATEDLNAYYLYIRLESGNNRWYWLDQDGSNGETSVTHQANTCCWQGDPGCGLGCTW